MIEGTIIYVSECKFYEKSYLHCNCPSKNFECADGEKKVCHLRSTIVSSSVS